MKRGETEDERLDRFVAERNRANTTASLNTATAIASATASVTASATATAIKPTKQTTTPPTTTTTTTTTTTKNTPTPYRRKTSKYTNELFFIGPTQQICVNVPQYYCFKAKLPVLHPDIQHFYNLISLRIVKSGLSTVPEELGHLSKHGTLIELSLDFNELEVVPDSLAHITSLQRLTLSHNKLTTLPFQLGRLTLLTHLNVAHNQLIGLPESTRRLSNLTELYLQSNEMNVLPSHGDLSGPGTFPSGSGPTALTVVEDSNRVRNSERITEELEPKIKGSESPREIMYWFGRLKEEIHRGELLGATVPWLDGIARALGRHRAVPTEAQTAAKLRVVANKELLKDSKGMNAGHLKKELRKRKLDASYNGSRRELVTRIEQFVKRDNEQNALIMRGDWIHDVEMKYLEVLSLIDPHAVVTMKFWVWNAREL